MLIQFDSFNINIVDEEIAELIVNDGVKVTIETFEELESFFNKQFNATFGLLVNRINNYDMSFAAKSLLGSNENISAIAVVTYNKRSSNKTKEFMAFRKADKLIMKEFSGFLHGRSQALDWLKVQCTKSHS